MSERKSMGTQLSDEARRFLEERRYAVLATVNADGTPQQSVVWYELQGDEIMMNTRRGRLKDRNMRHDSRVSFCVEDELRYVTLVGSVALNDDQAIAQEDIKRLAARYDGPESAEQQMREQFSKEPRVTVRLRPQRIKEYGLS